MENTLEIIPTSDLTDGDTYRKLQRGGDYVVRGSVADLVSDCEIEDAEPTVYRQFGEDEDATESDTGARGR